MTIKIKSVLPIEILKESDYIDEHFNVDYKSKVTTTTPLTAKYDCLCVFADNNVMIRINGFDIFSPYVSGAWGKCTGLILRKGEVLTTASSFSISYYNIVKKK